MSENSFQALPGFRDFDPQKCAIRNYFFATWRKVAVRYGFVEYEVPTVESTELYLKKTGGELPTQLFRFVDQGQRDITLRPEITASLGRLAISTQRDYPKPLKWFEIGCCYRYEKPQKGRLREFYQFNADILGEQGSCADSELIALAIDCLLELGLQKEDVVVRVSDRKVWQDFAEAHNISAEQHPEFLAIIDKLERERPEQLQAKLDVFGLQLSQLQEFISNPPLGCSAAFSELQSDLAARGMQDFIELDLTIVRGLAYYTGLVFEIFDRQKNLRAVAGGGRYDNLVNDLSEGSLQLPATGFAMGDVVIRHLVEQCPQANALLQQFLAQGSCEVFVISEHAEQRAVMLGCVTELRRAGLRVDYALAGAKFNNQLKKAQKAGAAYVLVIPQPGEQAELRELASRASQKADLAQLVQQLCSQQAAN